MKCARAGGHHERTLHWWETLPPWQCTGRRWPKHQPSWLAAWRETHENSGQVINDGKKQSAAGCRGKPMTTHPCSPCGRVAFSISCKEKRPSGDLLILWIPWEPAPPPLPFQGQEFAGFGATGEGGARGWGTGQGIPATKSRKWLGYRSLGRTRSTLSELLTHHTTSQCIPHRQGVGGPSPFHPGEARMA